MSRVRPVGAPSGRQHEIAYEDQVGIVVEVGGGIREYRHGERAVLQGYGLDAICDGARGTPLAPWPNRLGDGRFTFDDTTYQVPLTEPDQHNAIHGFLRWRAWECVHHGASTVTMRAFVHPMPYWPFALEVTISYTLAADGLNVTTSVRNAGGQDAPWAHGQHPYLATGGGAVDDCRLTFHARTRIATGRRQLPTGRTPVRGTPFDFGEGRLFGPTKIDHAFTDLLRDEHGQAWLSLRGTDARTVTAWVDNSYPYLEVFTGDTLTPGRARQSLGVEPMTAPPDALQSGTDLVRLPPGQTRRHRWGVRLDPVPS